MALNDKTSRRRDQKSLNTFKRDFWCDTLSLLEPFGQYLSCGKLIFRYEWKKDKYYESEFQSIINEGLPEAQRREGKK